MARITPSRAAADNLARKKLGPDDAQARVDAKPTQVGWVPKVPALVRSDDAATLPSITAASAPDAHSMPQPPFSVADIKQQTDAYERLALLRPGQSATIAAALAAGPKDERQMFAYTLAELGLLQLHQISPADYFIRVQEHAADLSKGDGPAFVRLVGMAFSAGSSDYDQNQERRLTGGGPHPAAGLEDIYAKVVNRQFNGSTTATGFNSAVTDVYAGSTITHHFGELLQVGANRTQLLGSMAQDHLDGPENPGDVHNGNFAAMVGEALLYGRITPDQAVALTKWAYTTPGATPPFPKVVPGWWTKDTSTTSDVIKYPLEEFHAMGTIGDYRIENWLKAMPQT